jgi:uncharacterized membrane protein YeaQ/YmgE (transglycosylase-associated protein family)
MIVTNGDVPAGTSRERRRKVELALTLGLWGWIAVIAGALLFGILASSIGETRTGLEWLVDSIAAFVGAIVASEFIVAWQSFGPMFDGLAIVPALIGGLVVGGIVEVATRFMTGGRYAPAPV